MKRNWAKGDRVYAPNGVRLHRVTIPNAASPTGQAYTHCNRVVDQWWQGEDQWAKRLQRRGELCQQCAWWEV